MVYYGLLMLELLVEILARLPVKSLKRFQCVCKSWYHLIESEYFLSKHLQLFTFDNRNACLLIKHEPHAMSWVPEHSKLTRLSLSPERVVIMDDFGIPVFSGRGYVYLKACNANGIICLCYNYLDDHVSFFDSSKFCQDVLLWNPSIREYLLLPKQPVKYEHDPDVCFLIEECEDFNVSYKFNALGFGYDAIHDDYKVIRMVEFYVEELRGTDRPHLIELYSLKSNAWRELDILINVSVLHRSCSEMFLNGAYHWLATELPEREKDFILSFNMADETFARIQLPDMDALNSLRKNFAVLNNSISMILYNENQNPRSFDIWSMKEYGVKESWTKLHSVGPLGIIREPLGYGSNGELLVYSNNGMVAVWDEDKQKHKVLQIGGVSFSSGALVYVESLVSIRRIIGA